MAGPISTSWNVATDPLPALPSVSQIPADLTNTSRGSSAGSNSSDGDNALDILLTFLSTASFALGPVAGPLVGGGISALKSLIDSFQSSQTSMQPLLSNVVTDLGTITSQGQINKDAGALQTYYTELSGQIAALDFGDLKAIPADIETDSGPLGQLFQNLKNAVSNPNAPLILAVGDLQNGGGLNSQLTYQAQAFSPFIGAAGYHIFLYYYYWKVLNQCKASERAFSTREFIIQIKNYAYYAIKEVNAITDQIASRLDQISSVKSGNQFVSIGQVITGLSFHDTGTIIAYPVPPNNCSR